jgi:hypothetical protein
MSVGVGGFAPDPSKFLLDENGFVLFDENGNALEPE